MKRLFGFIGTAALIIMALSFVPACDDDDDNPATPTTGSISGTVDFRGTWPTKLTLVPTPSWAASRSRSLRRLPSPMTSNRRPA